jgi:predicted amidophosphoribosyltransferase
MRAYRPKPDKWYEVMVRLTGKEKLCAECGNKVDQEIEPGESWCWHGFYPITSDGQNCPYYKKGDVML